MEETILLNFEVDQTQAQQNLVQTEKNILSLKKQQAELNKEYKAGKVSEDEYVKSNIKLQQSIKKETDQKAVLNRLIQTESNSRNAMRQRVSDLNKEYNNLNLTTEKGIKRADALQKELTELNTELNKGSKAAGNFKDNIGNYPQQFGDAAKSVKVAGSSVGDLTDKFKGLGVAGLAIGAVVGVVGALGAAYARSSTGARDLAYAQSLLSATTGVLAESFGELFDTAGEGEGFFSNVLTGILVNLSPSIAGAALQIAAFEQQLKDLETSRAFAAGFAKDDERRAELARRIRDDEEESFETRLAAAKEIDATLERSGQRTSIIIKAQIEAIKGSTQGYEKNREAQLKVAQLTAEIADKEEEITGKLTENVKARETIQKTIRDLNRAERRQTDNVDATTDNPLTNAFQNDLDIEEEANDRFQNRVLKDQREFENERIRESRRSAEARIKIEEQLNDARLQATSSILGSISSLFDQESDEYKAFASAQVIISTYAAATKAYEAAFLPLPTVASPAIGTAFAAAAIAQGLANLAQINGVQFAEGGVVLRGPSHAQGGIPIEAEGNEIILTKGVYNNPNLRAQASALNVAGGGRKFAAGGVPFTDGGFVTNQNISATQQAMIMANAVKNLPPAQVSWSEGRAVGRRVEARERAARI